LYNNKLNSRKKRDSTHVLLLKLNRN
jgi:hypothetical protein